MLMGKYPFQDDNRTKLFDKILFDNSNIDKTCKLSKEAIDLLTLLLTKDPENRPEASEVIDHPWFTKNIHDIFQNNVADLEIIPILKNFKTPNPFIKKILKILIKEVDIPKVEVLRQKFYIMDNKKNGVVDIGKYKSDIIEPLSIELANTCVDTIERTQKIFSDFLLTQYCFRINHHH